MISSLPVLAAMTDTQWTVAGGAFGAVLLAITTISVALISRSTSKQATKDETAVETVAALTLEIAELRTKVSGQASEIRWLRKQLER